MNETKQINPPEYMQQEYRHLLYLAWQQAYRSRCCPPSEQLLSKSPSPELKAHLQVCPFCRQERDNPAPPPPLPSTAETPEWTDPEPGELWSLRPELAGWGPKQRYYNPPVVLIVSRPDHNSVTVLQTYGDMSMAAEDDLPIDEAGTGFAQPWNRYTVPSSMLFACLGRIQTGLLAKASQPPAKEPNIQPGSLLWFFRNMEVETGYFFASQGITDLLRQREDLETFLSLDHNQITTSLKQFPLQLPQKPTENILEFLARCEATDELFPLAASSLDRTEAVALRIRAHGNIIKEVHPVPVQITDYVHLEQTIHVGGTFPEGVDQRWHCYFWWLDDNRLIEPVAGQFGVRNNAFWASFPCPDGQSRTRGKLVIRILDLF